METSSATSATPWKDFSLTSVQYPEGDSLGRALAAASLAPLGVAVAHATFFCLTRDCHTLAFGVGTILNFAFNSYLKHLIGERRPETGGSRGDRGHFSEFGMPSCHSQFAVFYCVYLHLFVFFRLNSVLPWEGGSSSGRRCLAPLLKLSFTAVTVGVTALVLWGRVYLLYHTTEQVVVGAAVGAACGAAWFLLTQYLFTPLIFPLGRRLWLHDLTRVDGFLAKVDSMAWTEEEGERGGRKKKT